MATDTSKSRCSGYFLSTQGIKYELWHKSWEGQVDLFAACPLGFRGSISWFSSCWQVSSQDTKCKCFKAQKSLPGEDKGWTLRPLGGRAQVDSPPPPQLLPWKGVETLLKTDSPGGFRLIEAIALASQTCTLHPVARPHSSVISAVNGPWGDNRQWASLLASAPPALGSSLY